MHKMIILITFYIPRVTFQPFHNSSRYRYTRNKNNNRTEAISAKIYEYKL